MGQLPIPVAALSKAWVCAPSLAEIVGSNPAGGRGLHRTDSVVGMVTGLQARRSWVRIPSVTRDFVSPPSGPDGWGVHPGLCSMSNGVLSPGKAAGDANVDNSSPSTFEVNEWKYTTTFPSAMPLWRGQRKHYLFYPISTIPNNNYDRPKTTG